MLSEIADEYSSIEFWSSMLFVMPSYMLDFLFFRLVQFVGLIYVFLYPSLIPLYGLLRVANEHVIMNKAIGPFVDGCTRQDVL